jgi:hypothetical protein
MEERYNMVAGSRDKNLAEHWIGTSRGGGKIWEGKGTA